MKVRHSVHLYFTTEVDDVDDFGGTANERAYADRARHVQDHLHEAITNAILNLGAEDIKMSQEYVAR